MNILHVLSQFEVTGAEVYAATLIGEQIRHDHTVVIASDTFSTPVSAMYVPLPIGERSYVQRISNIRSLVKLVRDYHIDLIHAHSRAASWVSYFASRYTRTAFISTVHGRQHVHASSRSYSIYGRHIIAVSESIKDHLVRELGLNPENIAVIPNGLDPRCWISRNIPKSRKEVYSVSPSTKVVLFVGRLSGPKGDVVRFLVSNVIPIVSKKTRCVFYVIGGERRPDGFPNLIDAANKEHWGPIVRLFDFQQDIGPYLNHADVVIGSGRVAIEALAVGKTTIAFGESNYLGRITADSFSNAKRSNFGDTGVRSSANAEIVAKECIHALERPTAKREILAIKKLSRQYFDIAIVEPEVQAIYERAVLRMKVPEHIPVLMYHRVVMDPAHDSQHGIWVTTGQLEQQLRSLRKRGFTTITFHQFEEFRRGKGTLPAKPVILTFDDGYEDNYSNAFPLLQKYRATSVVYVVVNKKRRTNFWDAREPQRALISARQMREMAQAGIEFGSHTITHANLTQITSTVASKEIAQSKDILEQMLGDKVVSFAYPFSALNSDLKRVVRESGYRYAVAGDRGPAGFCEDFFEIRRTQVFPWTTAIGFWKKTQSWYSRYKETKR